jgi:HlyD family secretion protein
VVNASRETPILFVVAANLKTTLITAHVAEADIGRVHKGLPVRFTVDAYPDDEFYGKIKAILKSPINQGRSVSYPVIISVSDDQERLLPGMTTSIEFVHEEAESVLKMPIAALYYTPADFIPELSKKEEKALYGSLKENQIKLPNDEKIKKAMLMGFLVGKIFKEGRRPIYILRDKKIEMVGIKIGAQDEDSVEIKLGLKAGDKILVGTY